MNILDENIIDSQRQRLRRWRIAMRHMGYDVGRQGMKDQEILALLHRLRHPTFFTRDEDFYARRLCHARYCLVYLAVTKDEVAPFVRRLLRHREFDSEEVIYHDPSAHQSSTDAPRRDAGRGISEADGTDAA